MFKFFKCGKISLTGKALKVQLGKLNYSVSDQDTINYITYEFFKDCFVQSISMFNLTINKLKLIAKERNIDLIKICLKNNISTKSKYLKFVYQY